MRAAELDGASCINSAAAFWDQLLSKAPFAVTLSAARHHLCFCQHAVAEEINSRHCIYTGDRGALDAWLNALMALLHRYGSDNSTAAHAAVVLAALAAASAAKPHLASSCAMPGLSLTLLGAASCNNKV